MSKVRAVEYFFMVFLSERWWNLWCIFWFSAVDREHLLRLYLYKLFVKQTMPVSRAIVSCHVNCYTVHNQRARRERKRKIRSSSSPKILCILSIKRLDFNFLFDFIVEILHCFPRHSLNCERMPFFYLTGDSHGYYLSIFIKIN